MSGKNGNPKLPHSLEAERIVLAAALYRDLSASALENSLHPDDFYDPKHQEIAKCIVRLGKRGDGINYSTVYRELEARKVEITVSELADLVDPADIPSISDIDPFIRTIRNKSISRRAYYACQKAMDQILLGDDGTETISWAQKAFTDLSSAPDGDGEDGQTPGEIIESFGGFQQYIVRQSIPGIPYPMAEMNRLTHGMHDGQLIVISGSAGKGKTAMALNIAHHAAMNGSPVDYFSMEMSKAELLNRLICIHARVDSQHLRNPDPAEAGRILEATQQVIDLPVRLYDKSSVTLPYLEKTLRKSVQNRRTRLAFVDYLGLITSTGRTENRAQEIGKYTRGLKVLAGELGIPIVALSQLNRAPDKEERRPMLSDLRESGSIEQDAVVVWFVHAKRQYVAALASQWQEAELLLAKQRNGPANRYWAVNFCQSWGLFAEIENQEEHEQRDDQPKHRDNKKRERGKKQAQTPPPAGPDEQYGFTDRDMQ